MRGSQQCRQASSDLAQANADLEKAKLEIRKGGIERPRSAQNAEKLRDAEEHVKSLVRSSQFHDAASMRKSGY